MPCSVLSIRVSAALADSWTIGKLSPAHPEPISAFAAAARVRYDASMSSITAVLDACPDGTLHLPLPPDLRGIRVRVEAKLEAASSAAKRPVELRAIMQKIRDRNPFRGVSDPVAWQRAAREDVRVPGRD